MAVSSSLVAVKSAESPYRIDPDQALKASQALLTHIQAEAKKLQQSNGKRNLLAENNTRSDSEDEDVNDNEDISQPVWLNLATKQHIVDKHRLKPCKIPVPHPLNNSPNLTICLITADPQRAVKNTVADPTFPTPLSTRITKIISVTKLAARYKSFESRRQLLSEHDIFLADDRIVTRLPKVLGKIFYKGTSKRPIPISISPRKTDEEKKQVDKKRSKSEAENQVASVASPTIVSAEIDRALKSIPVSLQPGLNVSIRIGHATFSPQQLSENILAVVPILIERHVVKGWRNVRSINIKSPTSFAIPIWLSDNLWTDPDSIIEPGMNVDGVAPAIEDTTTTTIDEKKRKRNPATQKGPQTGQRKKTKVTEAEDKTEEKSKDQDRKRRLASQKAKAFQES